MSITRIRDRKRSRDQEDEREDDQLPSLRTNRSSRSMRSRPAGLVLLFDEDEPDEAVASSRADPSGAMPPGQKRKLQELEQVSEEDGEEVDAVEDITVVDGSMSDGVVGDRGGLSIETRLSDQDTAVTLSRRQGDYGRTTKRKKQSHDAESLIVTSSDEDEDIICLGQNRKGGDEPRGALDSDRSRDRFHSERTSRDTVVAPSPAVPPLPYAQRVAKEALFRLKRRFKECRLRKRTNKWIREHVDRWTRPGVAFIRARSINYQLLACDDLLNIEAMWYRSILQGVRDRLTSRREDRIIGFENVKFLVPTEMIEVRAFLKAPWFNKEHTGVAVCDQCSHPCHEDYPSYEVEGRLPIRCVSDPDQRAGCFNCVRHKLPCSQRMDERNDNFVSSQLDAVIAERTAVDAWSTEINIVITLADELRTLLASDPDAASASQCRILVKILLGQSGVKEALEQLEKARQKIGRENKTRISDNPRERTKRWLDRGQRLVWSLTTVVKSEQRAFDALLAVVRRAQKQAEIQLDPAIPQHIRCVGDKIALAFPPGSKLAVAQAEVLEARKLLGKAKW